MPKVGDDTPEAKRQRFELHRAAQEVHRIRRELESAKLQYHEAVDEQLQMAEVVACTMAHLRGVPWITPESADSEVGESPASGSTTTTSGSTSSDSNVTRQRRLRLAEAMQALLPSLDSSVAARLKNIVEPTTAIGALYDSFFSRYITGHRMPFPPVLIHFSLGVCALSNRAYEMVSNSLGSAVPSLRTLRSYADTAGFMDDLSYVSLSNLNDYLTARSLNGCASSCTGSLEVDEVQVRPPVSLANACGCPY
jgi:hypothetical protein